MITWKSMADLTITKGQAFFQIMHITFKEVFRSNLENNSTCNFMQYYFISLDMLVLRVYVICEFLSPTTTLDFTMNQL